MQLRSGKTLPADIVVSATGLKLQLFGGAGLSLDGVDVNPSTRCVYKGLMCNDVPNFAMSIGYTNASWTLKADLTSEYICRLLRYMERRGHSHGTPRTTNADAERSPLLDFQADYVLRSASLLPFQGTSPPWRLYQNYLCDLLSLRFGRLTESMEFG